jgi:hypothetical protein
MAIARKPKNTEEKSRVDVDALINKGGSVAKLAEPSSADDAATGKQVALRIPSPMLGDIDSLVKQRTVRIPRHTWILEAIAEKLERENAGAT